MVKILLIEDDILWRSNLLSQLDKLGLNDVVECENITDALQHLSNETPDLIITDIILGDSNAFELFKHKQYLDIPCIFVTVSESMFFYDLSKTMKSSAYLIKPFHYISLQAAIDKVLVKPTDNISVSNKKSIQVKGLQNEQIELKINHIIYIASERNYSIIKTMNNQFKIKSSLASINEIFDNELMQVHRSYLVNKLNIIDANLNTMEIETTIGKIPIGITYKADLLKLLSENVLI